MKTALFLASALFATAAHADCTSQLHTEFDAARAEAIRVYPQQEAIFNAYHFSINNTNPGADGTTYLETHEISFNERMCNYPVAMQKSIAAHEFGHLVAFSVHPETLAARLSNKRGHNWEQDETLAIYYGAKLIAQDDRTAMLDHFEAKCEAHNHKSDYCDLYNTWQYSFTH